MDTDEQEIRLYLRGVAGQWVSAKEISRRVGGRRRFEREPHWAVPVLGRMVEKRMIETDSLGHYRVSKHDPRRRSQSWLAPRVRQILERSDKDFTHVLTTEELEEPTEEQG